MAAPDPPKGASPTVSSGNTVLLANAMPEAEYMYGCTPTALGMLLGYYDLYGYRGADLSNLIAGKVALKSRGTDGNAYNMNAFDTVLGNAIASEEYVYRFHTRDNKETTPAQELAYTFKDDGRTLNTDEWNCIADYIGTGQFWRGNGNLSTSITYGSLEELYGYDFNEPISDGKTTKQVPYLYTAMLYGLDLYAQSRGYALDYEITGTYLTDVCGGDFTFEDYMYEIDSGRPVLISIEGHSMVGYGYNAATREIVFDDCYRADQRMAWGGTYEYSGAKRALQTITVVGINVNGDVDLSVTGAAGGSGPLIVAGAPNASATSDYIIAGTPVYLTYTVSNEGFDPSGAFGVSIRIDGGLVSSGTVASLAGDANRRFSDVSLGELAIGLHNVRVTVDETNEIQEWSGLNNTAETDVLILKSGTSILTGTKNVDDWKTVSDTFVYGGGTLNLSEARALGAVLKGKITSRSSDGTVWYNPAGANVRRSGYMSATDVYAYGELNVSSGGTAADTRVFSGGEACVCGGGVASGMTVGSRGVLSVLSGGTLTGRIRFDSSAEIDFYDGSVLNFDLTDAAPGAPACVDDLSMFNGMPAFTVTVSDALDNGAYRLADGAYGFKETVAVYDSDGVGIDTLKPGGSFYVGKAKYSLSLSGGALTLTVSGKTVPDTVAPTVTGVKASTTAPTKQPVTVTAVFSDNIAVASSLYCVGTDGVWEPYTGGVTVTDNTTVYFMAVDAAGNESEIVSYAVTNIDKYLPVVYRDVILKNQEVNASFNDQYLAPVIGPGGGLRVFSGGTANSATVNSGGTLTVSEGGIADASLLNAGGRIFVFNGGELNGTVADSGPSPNGDRGVVFVSAGGTANNTYVRGGKLCVDPGGVVNGATVSDDGWFLGLGGTANDVLVSVGGLLQFAFGATANRAVVDGGRMEVFENGVANGTVVRYCEEDEYLRVYGGGTANDTVVGSGGCALVEGGGLAADTAVASGGLLVLGGASGNPGGAAVRTEVKSGGSVIVSSGGTASELEVSRGGMLAFDVAPDTYVQGWSGGSAFEMSDGFLSGYTVNSGGELRILNGGFAGRTAVNSGRVCVSGGGAANSTTVGYGGALFVCSGGAASAIDVRYGGMFGFDVAPDTYVQGWSGGSAFEMSDGFLSGYDVNAGGDVYLLSGGVAKDTRVNDGGRLVLCRGGSEFGTTVCSGGSLLVAGGVADGVTVDDGIILVCDGGVAYNTLVSSPVLSGETLPVGCIVSAGGVAFDTTVREMALTIAGGAANGVNLNAGAGILLEEGGLLTGRMMLEEGAFISAAAGEINFDLRDGFAGAPPFLNDLSAVSGNPLYTLTVAEGRTSGTYSLAGRADGFNGTLTVLNDRGDIIGRLSPGRTAAIRKVDYTLNVYKGDLIVSIGEPGPDVVPPTVGGVKASTKKPTNQPVTVTAVFSDNVGVASALYRIGEHGEWTDYADGVTVTENTTVYFLAVDAEGNESEIVSYAVTNIDNIPPEKPVPSPDITEPTKRRVAVSAEFGPDAARKEYSLDGTTWLKYTEAVRMTENGTVFFRGTDAAGNVSEIADYEVANIDKSLPDDGPDGGRNDYLYTKKKGLNPDAGTFPATALSDGFEGGVQMDEPGSVSVGGRVNFVGSYIGEYIDEFDYAKITLETAARLSFTVDATDNVKFAVCKLNETAGANGKVSRSLKTLQTTPFSLKNGASSVRSNTGGLLLEKGEYYISMQSVNAKKGGSAFYNVSLNSDGSTFFTKGDNGDDWGDLKTRGPSGAVGDIGKIGAGSGIVLEDWVGFGDAADYRLFTLETAARLFFSLRATDAAKFTVYRIDAKTDRNGEPVYSLKSLQSAKLARTGEAEYAAGTKGLLLEAGEYCVSMQSANAKKGGSADYVVSLDPGASEFFTKGDNGDDWGDLKTKGASGAVGDAGVISSGSGVVLEDWVGFGDAVDYRLFTLESDAQLSFLVSASDKTKFTICRIETKTDRNGEPVCSLKTLQSTSLKKRKDGDGFLSTTKLLLLDAGEYCFAMQSTNAKKGGSADYRVELDASSVFSGASSDAVSAGHASAAGSFTCADSGIAPQDVSRFAAYPETPAAGYASAAPDLFLCDVRPALPDLLPPA